jgi:Flp pilus assembly protein TadG
MTYIGLWRSRRAVAALEFALTAPFLLILTAGAVDFGIANYSRSALANAVASGAEYAVLSATNVTAANVQTVVQSTPNLTGVTATVTGPACYCLTGSTPTMSSVACNTSCSDGSLAGTYVIISASYSYAGLLSGFSYPSTFNISDSAVVRVQ